MVTLETTSTRRQRNICCIATTPPSDVSLAKHRSWCNSPTANGFNVKLMLHLNLIYKPVFSRGSQTTHTHKSM